MIFFKTAVNEGFTPHPPLSALPRGYGEQTEPRSVPPPLSGVQVVKLVFILQSWKPAPTPFFLRMPNDVEAFILRWRDKIASDFFKIIVTRHKWMRAGSIAFTQTSLARCAFGFRLADLRVTFTGFRFVVQGEGNRPCADLCARPRLTAGSDRRFDDKHFISTSLKLVGDARNLHAEAMFCKVLIYEWKMG